MFFYTVGHGKAFDELQKYGTAQMGELNMPPCGACREFMTQLMPEDYHKIEIMMDYENERIVTLGKLTPEWWI